MLKNGCNFFSINKNPEIVSRTTINNSVSKLDDFGVAGVLFHWTIWAFKLVARGQFGQGVSGDTVATH